MAEHHTDVEAGSDTVQVDKGLYERANLFAGNLYQFAQEVNPGWPDRYLDKYLTFELSDSPYFKWLREQYDTAQKSVAKIQKLKADFDNLKVESQRREDKAKEELDLRQQMIDQLTANINASQIKSIQNGVDAPPTRPKLLESEPFLTVNEWPGNLDPQPGPTPQDTISGTAGTRRSTACQLGHIRSMKDRREFQITSSSSSHTRESGRGLRQSPWLDVEATSAGMIRRQLTSRPR